MFSKPLYLRTEFASMLAKTTRDDSQLSVLIASAVKTPKQGRISTPLRQRSVQIMASSHGVSINLSRQKNLLPRFSGHPPLLPKRHSLGAGETKNDSMHRGCHEREDGGTLNGSLSKTTYSQSRGGYGGGGGSCSGSDSGSTVSCRVVLL